MATEPTSPGDNDLELVGLVVVRANHRAGILLDQESHRIDFPWFRWRRAVRRVAIRADVTGEPEAGAIGTRAPSRRMRLIGGGNHRHEDTFPGRLQRTKITAMSEQDILAAIRFDAKGLVPAIAQQHDTGEVLMLAWMNRDAVTETLATGRVCYFSRSRDRLWRKGEVSGQVQHLKELRVDCDGDTLLLLVDQQGVACHTGRRNCFFRAMRDGALVEIAAPLVAPETLYG
jgi:phosphoribosyl-AMP cyclohydrolase